VVREGGLGEGPGVRAVELFERWVKADLATYLELKHRS